MVAYFNGRALRAVREAKGVSRETLGRLIGRSPATLAHYEAGVSIPPSDVLARAAEALGVPVNRLFDGDEPDNVGAMDAAIRKAVDSLNLTDGQKRRLAVLLTTETGDTAVSA